MPSVNIMAGFSNIDAFLNTLTLSCRALPIVTLYVTEGCNLKCISCSYRQALPEELSLAEIKELAATLKQFGLQHIVYSGGEPLLRRDFPEICRVFAALPVRQTLLTNGVLLEKRFAELESFFTEIIVSIDGANENTHNAIRGSECFAQILAGVKRVTGARNRPRVSIRMVVQKQNFRELPQMVGLAKSLNVDRISFLAADVLSDSFGRASRGKVVPDQRIMLDENEVGEFHSIVRRLSIDCRAEIERRFISESIDKLFHLVHYFEALLGKRPFPRNSCNAPMVSAVITSTGKIEPCFFLPAYGDARSRPVHETINGSDALRTRRQVREYSLDRCQTCVCTLHVSPMNALFNKF